MGEIWVVTRANNRSVIEKELSKKPLENLHFVFADLPRWASFWKSGERGMHLYYLLWQIFIFKKVKELNELHHFDIIHHLTFGNIWLPTFMPLINIPFIWGPIGGAEKISGSFIKYFSLTAKLKEYVRIFLIATLKFNPYFLYCCKKANSIIVKTEQTEKSIPDKYNYKVIRMTDVGINIDDINTERPIYDDTTRIICVGKLLYWRGFDLAIKSLRKIRTKLNNATLVIVGNGPEKERLKNIAKNEGVPNNVLFLGELNKALLSHEMNKSTIFLNPCLKEGGVTAIIEAMQRGMPVVSVDTGGVTNIVPMMKVPLKNPNQVVSNLSENLLKICRDSQLRSQIGNSCRKSVEKHKWQDKTKEIYKIYEREAFKFKSVMGYQ